MAIIWQTCFMKILMRQQRNKVSAGSRRYIRRLAMPELGVLRRFRLPKGRVGDRICSLMTELNGDSNGSETG